MGDVVAADSQLSAHLQGLLFGRGGQGCDQAPGERRGRLRRAQVFAGGLLSLLDQWKSQTLPAWVQLTALRGRSAEPLGL